MVTALALVAAVLLVEFAGQLVLAPDKLRYLRGHWLAAIAVALRPCAPRATVGVPLAPSPGTLRLPGLANAP